MGTINPLGELAFTKTPLAADFESGQLLASDHASYRLGRQVEQFSGLPNRKKTRRVNLIDHRRSQKALSLFGSMIRFYLALIFGEWLIGPGAVLKL